MSEVSIADEAFSAGNFKEAASAYRALCLTAPNADLFFNLGTAEAHAGRLGPAVWAFEQALIREPEHDDAAVNLEAVRTLAVEAGLGRAGGLRTLLPGDDDAGTGLLTALTPTTTDVAFAVSWVGLFVLLALQRTTKEATRSTAFGLLAVLAALSSFGFGGLSVGRTFVVDRTDYALVIADRSRALLGPGEQYQATAQLTAGVKVRVRGRDGGFLHVTLPDGGTAWAASSDLAMLTTD
ncbi:MAG: hypothetical protein EXR76_10505 [Myxococcales bacterium]|nr:hypothetical protein [Myxococcales bacterium]